MAGHSHEKVMCRGGAVEDIADIEKHLCPQCHTLYESMHYGRDCKCGFVGLTQAEWLHGGPVMSLAPKADRNVACASTPSGRDSAFYRANMVATEFSWANRDEWMAKLKARRLEREANKRRSFNPHAPVDLLTMSFNGIQFPGIPCYPSLPRLPIGNWYDRPFATSQFANEYNAQFPPEP